MKVGAFKETWRGVLFWNETLRETAVSVKRSVGF